MDVTQRPVGVLHDSFYFGEGALHYSYEGHCVTSKKMAAEETSRVVAACKNQHEGR